MTRMNELLTTGQMIDRLKEGEVAVCENNWYKIKVDEGILTFARTTGVFEKGEMVTLVPKITGVKWRILPEYKSFDEAMKALKDNKKVIFSNDHYKFVIESDYYLEELEGFTFEDLFNGEWTIEETGE